MELKINPPVDVAERDGCGKVSAVYEKHVVEFTIRDFVYEANKAYSSPTFKIMIENTAVQFCIVLFIPDGHISIYLQCLPQYREQMRGKLNLIVKSGQKQGEFDNFMDAENYGTLGWGGHLYGVEVDRYNFNTLCVDCNIYFLYLRVQSDPLVWKVSQKQLSKDLGNLLSSEELWDVTLKVGDKVLKAHKNILSARSPVFNRMFKTDMAEAQLNTVEITDIDFEVLQSILEYIYTDKMDVGENVEELLVSAEKYQLEGLKDKCQEALAQSLTVENAARIFALSDQYRAEQLKAKTIYFINCNKQAVLATEEMKSLMQTQPAALLAAFFK